MFWDSPVNLLLGVKESGHWFKMCNRVMVTVLDFSLTGICSNAVQARASALCSWARHVTCAFKIRVLNRILYSRCCGSYRREAWHPKCSFTSKGPKLLGGSGGMLPQENCGLRCSEMRFLHFGAYFLIFSKQLWVDLVICLVALNTRKLKLSLIKLKIKKQRYPPQIISLWKRRLESN